MAAVVDVPHRAVTADAAQDLPFCRLLLANRAHLRLLPLLNSVVVSRVRPGPLLPTLAWLPARASGLECLCLSVFLAAASECAGLLKKPCGCWPP